MKLQMNAQEARSIGGGYAIRETGKYAGLVITRAELLQASSGTIGLGLSVRDDSGASCNYLSIYHTKSDGSKLSGSKMVSAILACLRMRECDTGQIEIESWNPAAGKLEKRRVNGYPAMIGKRIGLLLREVWETNSRTGEDLRKMEIYAPFESASELTASEILDGAKSPEKLGRLLEQMLKKPIDDRRDGGAQGNQRQPQPASPKPRAAEKPATSFDDMDDDIPF